jgi:hypothetical protein
MKNGVTVFLLLGLLLGNIKPSFSDCRESDLKPNPLRPYVGINYKHTWVNPKGEWQKILVNSYPGFGFFLGLRFLKPFGIEAGYDWTANKPKVVTVGADETLLGIHNSKTPVLITGKTRFKNPHVDLTIFFSPQLLESLDPEIMLSLGMARVTAKSKMVVSPDLEPLKSLSLIAHKPCAVARLGLGLQSRIIENVGLRVLWRWENYAALKTFRNASSLTSALYLQF